MPGCSRPRRWGIGGALLLATALSACERAPPTPSPPPPSPSPGGGAVAPPDPAPPPAGGEPRFAGFRDVATEAGLVHAQLCGDEPPRTILDVKSTGVALLDFDGDRRQDIFLASGSTLERFQAGEPGFPCRLYRNLGGLRFEEVADRAGLPEFRFACGAAAADVDGNGLDDLLVTGVGPDRIFLNCGGRFEEVADSGLADDGWSTSAAFADLDGDGILDLYIARYLDFDIADPPVHGPRWSCLWENRVVICGPRGIPALPDRVLAGRGDGTFRDVAAEWGFAETPPGYGLAVVISDLVGDPAPEIFVANDSSPNFLWTRGPDGRWRDVGFLAGVSVSADGEEQAGMGVDSGDVDGDGRFDLVVTNFEREACNLYLSSGPESFFDRADAWGLAVPTRPALSWGTGFEDFDRDGDLDLFIANGHVYPQADEVETSPGYRQRSQLFLQEQDASGRPRFVERGLELGITRVELGRAAAFGDLDDDGDVDILAIHRGAPPALYENLGAAGSRGAALRLEQPGKNREAIGARLEVRIGDRRYADEVRRQSSFQSSGDPRVFIGLGAAAGATDPAESTVRWPDGRRERFSLPRSGGAATLRRGEGAPVE